MKRLDIDLSFFRQDRRKSVTIEGCDPQRFKFVSSAQRMIRAAKNYVRRADRRAGKTEMKEQFAEFAALCTGKADPRLEMWSCPQGSCHGKPCGTKFYIQPGVDGACPKCGTVLHAL